MRQRIKKYLFETLKILLILFLAINAVSYFRAPSLSDEKLPYFNLVTIDNQTLDSAAFSGRPVLIHFWATWCPTCKTELPNIAWISEKFKVVTIAVKSGDDETIRQFMEQNGYDFAVINDDGQWSSLFSVNTYPTTFIYNAEGNLAFTEVGYTSTIGLYLRMLWAE